MPDPVEPTGDHVWSRLARVSPGPDAVGWPRASVRSRSAVAVDLGYAAMIGSARRASRAASSCCPKWLASLACSRSTMNRRPSSPSRSSVSAKPARRRSARRRAVRPWRRTNPGFTGESTKRGGGFPGCHPGVGNGPVDLREPAIEATETGAALEQRHPCAEVALKQGDKSLSWGVRDVEQCGSVLRDELAAPLGGR